MLKWIDLCSTVGWHILLCENANKQPANTTQVLLSYRFENSNPTTILKTSVYPPKSPHCFHISQVFSLCHIQFPVLSPLYLPTLSAHKPLTQLCTSHSLEGPRSCSPPFPSLGIRWIKAALIKYNNRGNEAEMAQVLEAFLHSLFFFPMAFKKNFYHKYGNKTKQNQQTVKMRFY